MYRKLIILLIVERTLIIEKSLRGNDEEVITSPGGELSWRPRAS
jgi:hypothetical protein